MEKPTNSQALRISQLLKLAAKLMAMGIKAKKTSLIARAEYIAHQVLFFSSGRRLPYLAGRPEPLLRYALSSSCFTHFVSFAIENNATCDTCRHQHRPPHKPTTSGQLTPFACSGSG